MTPWTVAYQAPLRPWGFPGKSTGVGCHFLLQGIFPTQGLYPGLLHCRQMLYHLSHQGWQRESIKKLGWLHLDSNRGGKQFCLRICSCRTVLYCYYFWLCCLCCVGFSLVLVGRVSSWGVEAFHCSGFSRCGAWALGCLGFSSCSTWAQYLQL